MKKHKTLLGKINAWLHLWLGIFAGSLLVIIALSGTLVVYGDEIINLSAGNAKYVEQVTNNRLPIEKIITEAKRQAPQYNLSEMLVYKDPSRTVRFRTFNKASGLSMLYIDPYSGKVLKIDHTANFFYVMAHIHSSFLWHGGGNWIVDIATLIFLIELITGIILWWPKKWTQHNINKSFKIKWKAKWKRVNYDLHNVLGFYSSLLAIILTVTGLIIAFEPVAKATVASFGGDTNLEWHDNLPKADLNKKAVPLDPLIEQQLAAHPNAKLAQIWVYNIDKIGYYPIITARNAGLKSNENPQFAFFDKYNGAPLHITPKNLKTEHISNTYWALHMGTWMGQLGKLFTFFCGLICTSLPITGFIIWLKRKKKKSNKKQSVLEPV